MGTMRGPERRAGRSWILARPQLALPLLSPHPQAKIVLLLPLDKRQQRAEAAAGPGVRPQRPNEDAMRVRAGLLASPMFRGAGDGPDRRERACRCPLKVQVLLLQLDAQRQQEGHRAEGGAGAGGGAAARGARPRAAPGPQRLPCRQPTRNGADAERDPGEQRP